MKAANLAAYKKKKEGKVKPAAKSMVTLDVKPWGSLPYSLVKDFELIFMKMTKPT